MALNFLRQKQIFDQFGQPVDDGSSPDYSSLDSTSDDSLPDPSIPDATPDVSNGIPPEMPRQIPRVPEMPAQIPQTPNISYSATADSQSQAPTTPPVSDYDRMMQLYEKLYQPQHTATDRLNALMNEAPNPDQYKPGFGRGLAAIGLSLGKGGWQEGQKALDAPYAGAMEEWKVKAAPYQQAAQLENTENINARQAASSTAANILASEKNTETQRANQAKEAIAATRAAAYDFKEHHPDWKFDTSGPNIIAMNPATKETVNLGPTTHLTDGQKIDLKGYYQVEAAKETQGGAMQRTIAGGTGIFQLPDGSLARPDPNDPSGTKLIPVSKPAGTPAGPVSKPGTAPAPNALEQMRERSQKLSDILAVVPGADEFIHNVGPDKYDMDPRPQPTPGTFWGTNQPDPKKVALWDKLKKMLDPTYVPASTDGGPSHAPDGPFLPPGTKIPNQTGGGGIQQHVDSTDLARFSSDQLAGIDSGTKVFLLNGKTGEIIGMIPNTPEAKNDAIKKGFGIRTGR